MANYNYKCLFGFVTVIFSTMGIVFKSYSEPLINTNTTYYEVQGKTVTEIKTSLNNNSPIFENGRKFHARTNWNFKWNFSWQEFSNSCKITSVKTSLDIKYIFPKLTNYSSLSPSLKKQWDQYYQALVKHEEGHKNLAIKAAKDIENNILQLGQKNTCQNLEKEANNLGNKILQESNKQQQKYDQETNHGEKTGAIFPPN